MFIGLFNGPLNILRLCVTFTVKPLFRFETYDLKFFRSLITVYELRCTKYSDKINHIDYNYIRRK